MIRKTTALERALNIEMMIINVVMSDGLVRDRRQRIALKEFFINFIGTKKTAVNGEL